MGDKLYEAIRDAFQIFAGEDLGDGRINDLIEAFEMNGIELKLAEEEPLFVNTLLNMQSNLDPFRPIHESPRQAMFAAHDTTLDFPVHQPSDVRIRTGLEKVDPPTGHVLSDIHECTGVVPHTHLDAPEKASDDIREITSVGELFVENRLPWLTGVMCIGPNEPLATAGFLFESIGRDKVLTVDGLIPNSVSWINADVVKESPQAEQRVVTGDLAKFAGGIVIVVIEKDDVLMDYAARELRDNAIRNRVSIIVVFGFKTAFKLKDLQDIDKSKLGDRYIIPKVERAFDASFYVSSLTEYFCAKNRYDYEDEYRGKKFTILKGTD